MADWTLRALLALGAMALAGCTATPEREMAVESNAVPATQQATAEREGLPRRVEPRPESPPPRTYQCEDLRIEARWQDPRSLVLILPDRDIRLTQAMAASGVRYASHEGQFWGKGDGDAQLILPGQPPRQCQSTELRSPWAQAREDGIAFRAVGQEPGWVLEVDRASQPAMRIRGLNGEVAWSSASTTVLPAGWRGVSEPADGSQGMEVTVHFETTRCMDIATGYAYRIQATIWMGDEVLKGCGRFL